MRVETVVILLELCLQACVFAFSFIFFLYIFFPWGFDDEKGGEQAVVVLYLHKL